MKTKKVKEFPVADATATICSEYGNGSPWYWRLDVKGGGTVESDREFETKKTAWNDLRRVLNVRTIEVTEWPE